MRNGHHRPPPDKRCSRCCPDFIEITFAELYAEFAKLGFAKVKELLNEGWDGPYRHTEDRIAAVSWLKADPAHIAFVNAKFDELGFKRARALIDGDSAEDEWYEEENELANKWVLKHHPDNVGVDADDIPDDEPDTDAPDADASDTSDSDPKWPEPVDLWGNFEPPPFAERIAAASN
jgi:hypothetical protein